jgi:hypothetical protein
MTALQEMELAELRVMVQLAAVPSLEVWYWVQGTLTAKVRVMRRRATMMLFMVKYLCR